MSFNDILSNKEKMKYLEMEVANLSAIVKQLKDLYEEKLDYVLNYVDDQTPLVEERVKEWFCNNVILKPFDDYHIMAIVKDKKGEK